MQRRILIMGRAIDVDEAVMSISATDVRELMGV